MSQAFHLPSFLLLHLPNTGACSVRNLEDNVEVPQIQRTILDKYHAMVTPSPPTYLSLNALGDLIFILNSHYCRKCRSITT
ncbi:hypothetical protein BDQ17DRAFT_1344677 [Cyathus striatus]|nr:hypothetical protein BDQ17DRAFT_1344677 [Cyathus striatus]